TDAREGPAVLASAPSAEGLATELHLVIQPGANHADLPLEQGETIIGRVLDDQGRPAVGAVVSAFPAEPRIHDVLRWVSHQDTTTSDGRFALVAIDPGQANYGVSASTRSASSERVVVAAGARDV